MNKNILAAVVIIIVAVGGFLLLNKKSENKLKEKGFSTNITNPYFALTPGTKLTYLAKKSDGGQERGEFYVTSETKTVAGIETVVVWDRVWLNGSLTEDTRDWFAQDKDGNVWYFGEDTAELENGVVVNQAGSWEAGVDGAEPGIIMEANPKVGDVYKEEYYAGKAEDKAEIISLNEEVKVPFGSFSGCLQTKNYTPLEPNLVEYKYYCKEVGNTALEIDAEDNEKFELTTREENAEPSPSTPTDSTKNKAVQKPASSPSPTPTPPASITVITEAQAKAIATARVPGTVTDVAVEQKFGKQTYVVEIDPGSGPETDVIVDMQTGAVLAVEQ
jgi:uncharacterized membrane protein YkoI